jgi:hypothetical protein
MKGFTEFSLSLILIATGSTLLLCRIKVAPSYPCIINRIEYDNSILDTQCSIIPWNNEKNVCHQYSTCHDPKCPEYAERYINSTFTVWIHHNTCYFYEFSYERWDISFPFMFFFMALIPPLCLILCPKAHVTEYTSVYHTDNMV